MAKMPKTQKQLILLGVIVLVVIGVLIYLLVASQSGPSVIQGEYQAPKVDTSFKQGVFDNPEYPKLSSPVHLPLDPGPSGRPNPFDSI